MTTYAWLIENYDREYLAVANGLFVWTSNPMEALRFSRKEDADKVAELIDEDAQYVVEHAWHDNQGLTMFLFMNKKMLKVLWLMIDHRLNEIAWLPLTKDEKINRLRSEEWDMLFKLKMKIAKKVW